MRHPRRIAPTAFSALLLALCAAGCGDDDAAPVKTAATPAAHEPEHEATFEPGHSKAVRRYYGTPHTHDEPEVDGLELDTEEEYHQPPHPATGEIGDTITLTGTNLGVRMDVTVTSVKTGKRHTRVGIHLANTGIAIFESRLTRSFVVDADGRRARLATGAKAPCSNGLGDILRLDVGQKRAGCLVYRSSGSRPVRLQLALEEVPAAAGGRWSLR
jgi:hypothetical protein